MDTATYQVKKNAVGGFSVAYDCPHCGTALTAPLTQAGVSVPCLTCTTPSVVPGKANLDWLNAKQEADRRKMEQARRLELQKAEHARQQAEAERVRLSLEDDAEAEVADDEDEVEAYWKTHCRYCYEEIKENAKKCKNCCEYLDEALRATETAHDVVSFRPSPADVFWLAAKFWAATLLFAGVGYLLYSLCGAVVARMY